MCWHQILTSIRENPGFWNPLKKAEIFVKSAKKVLAVLSDNILPPTKIQKRGNYVITLTHFHLYWKIITLQDIYTNMVEKVTKIHFSTNHRRETRREAHLPCESRPSTDVDATQAHQWTAMRKMVMGRLHLGAGCANRLGPPRGVSWWSPYVSCMWACMNMSREPTIGIAINRWGRPPHSHTPHKSLSPTLVSFYYS